jgi:aromatase
MAAHTDNHIIINAPLDLVWQIANDVDNWPNLFIEYAKAEIIERKGNTVTFRLTTFPDKEHNNTVWSWVSERTVDPQTHTVKAHRIETGPFQYMNIQWFFEPADGGTKMRWVQDFSMKPTAPANDEQAEQYINNNTKTQMAVIKERIEKRAAGG